MTYHDLLKQERPMPPQKETAMRDSIPDLVARVQALEALFGRIEVGRTVDGIDIILGKRDDETIEDAARRVVAERDVAVRERDEAVRIAHRIVYVQYDTKITPLCEGSALDCAIRLLVHYGLATDHGDGTFTLKEPKP